MIYFCYRPQKHKGTEGLIEIENPNLVKSKNIKVKDIDVSGILSALFPMHSNIIQCFPMDNDVVRHVSICFIKKKIYS